MSKDVDFLRLQLEPLATTVQANARAWVKELGRLLNESAKQNLMSLKTEMEVRMPYDVALYSCHSDICDCVYPAQFVFLICW